MNKVVQRVKPTVNDIARHAGVSLATVDRVLNERPGVRSVTIERVNNAVSELGYIRDTAAANLARGRVYRFVFLLPDSSEEFFDALQVQITTQSELLVNERTEIKTLRIPYLDSQEIACALDRLEPKNADGVAIIAPETPAVRDAVTRARSRGIAVVALLTDVPSSPRNHFIGIDNYSAGQTAAKLMGQFVQASKGSVLVLLGSRFARDHLERRYGFDEVMEQQFPHLSVLPSIEAGVSEKLAENILPDVFKAIPDVCGIYSTTSRHSDLLSFLNTRSENPVVVAHELIPSSRAALKSGVFDALISQDTGHIVRSAVRLMRAVVDAVPYNATQDRVRIEIFLKENLPEV